MSRKELYTLPTDEQLLRIITRVNVRRLAKGLFPVFIDRGIQMGGFRTMDIYLAEYQLLTIEDIKQHGYDVSERLSPQMTDDEVEEVLVSLFEKTTFGDIYGGLSHNYMCKFKVRGIKDTVTLFRDECHEIGEKHFEEMINEKGLYGFVGFNASQNEKKKDTHEKFEFTSEDEKDIFRAALVDGCSELQAYSVFCGDNGDFTTYNFNGYFHCSDDLFYQLFPDGHVSSPYTLQKRKLDMFGEITNEII